MVRDSPSQSMVPGPAVDTVMKAASRLRGTADLVQENALFAGPGPPLRRLQNRRRYGERTRIGGKQAKDDAQCGTKEESKEGRKGGSRPAGPLGGYRRHRYRGHRNLRGGNLIPAFWRNRTRSTSGRGRRKFAARRGNSDM